MADPKKNVPLPADEASRLAALHALGILYTPAEERFDRITRLACRSLDTPIALVSLVNSASQWLKSAQGMEVTETPRTVAFCAHAILQESTLVVPDTHLDPRFADNPLVTGEPFIRFYAGHPIRAADGSRLGTLCVIDRQRRELQHRDLQTLRDLAAWTESELKVKALSEAQQELIAERDALRRRAMLDSLTRLWNYEAIMEVLERELERSLRAGLPMSVLLADVDHFKSINEAHGYLAGNAALLEIARRIQGAVRPQDAVGRFGGEEFLIVLGNCDRAAAARLAEEMRVRVAAEEVEASGLRLPVTLSAGVATAVPAQAADPRALVHAANLALLRAKAGGRNRVETAAGA